MISASSSSSTKMRQYRHQMKKTKVFSGFTNQLKEVLGRLSGSRWCQMRRKPPPVYTTATPAPYPGSGPASCAPHSLGLLQGLRLLAPLPHWPFLSLLHSQQLKFCLNLSLEKKGQKPSSWVASGRPSTPDPPTPPIPIPAHREEVDIAS